METENQHPSRKEEKENIPQPWRCKEYEICTLPFKGVKKTAGGGGGVEESNESYLIKGTLPVLQEGQVLP